MELDQIISEHVGGKRLCLEIGASMKIEISSVNGFLKGEFIGMAAGKYLIIETPNIFNIRSKIYEGNQAIVRYLSGGTVYGFQSTIKSAYYRDVFRLLFLSYPMVVEEHNVRKHKRVECYIPASITVQEKTLAGIISDISEMGCSIEIKTESAVEVPVGVNVIISCYLLGMAEKQALKGIVRNTTKDRKKVKLGVEYEDLDAKLVSAISSYVSMVADFIDECDQCVAKE